MQTNNSPEERNPMHEAGAGEIGSIINNESQGGDVLGKTRRLNEVPEEVEKSKSGIIIGEKRVYAEAVLENFISWIDSPLDPPSCELLSGILVEVFRIIMPATRKLDSKGQATYQQDVYPVMRIIDIDPKTLRENPMLIPGTLVKGTNRLREYGVNGIWYEWNETRKGYDSSNETSNMAEPPYYTGFIHDWGSEYAFPNNPMVPDLHLNNRFLVPINEVQAVLDEDYVITQMKTMIDEIKKYSN